MAGPGSAGTLGWPRQTATVEQVPSDHERQLQPVPLEPLCHPDAGLEAVVGGEAEAARDKGPGEGRMTENNFSLKKIEISVSEAENAIEKEMSDGLQSAGHAMDVYASSIDDILEDEEHYAGQLKEYLFYAEALWAECRKHELMQYDLEMVAQDLASKKQQ
ncbi:hypothetical protein MC885_013304, partial [Smutsia gigantea]